ncbi:MAG TPA: pyridoxamine 5'-phosphate oxidase family protein [Ilumatobacter sp.]|nr:pyridoxamine 5'-phosphate oxidase family protein [Ilumatobacter sp.]
MNETPEDLERLQQLLDDSYVASGVHLREVITPERRLDAASLAARLDGMKLLVLATVTGDGRPICGPVDGVFYRGSFHFGSSPESIRFRHIRQRPAVSATHLDGEEFSVSVHGTATEIDLKATEHADFRRALLDVYVPLYGAGWEQFIDSGPVYARIDAHRMFTYFAAPGTGPS